jgi:uncharacterized membrane protein
LIRRIPRSPVPAIGAALVLAALAASADEPVVEVEAVEVVEVIQATCTKPCDDTGADEEVEAVEVVEVVQPVAEPGEDEAIEAVEEVDVVEAVEVVDAQVTGGAADEASFTVSRVFGRLHPALVHLPIGFLLLLLVVEVLSSFKRGGSLAACGLPMVVLTALSTIPAAISGLLRSAEMWGENGPDPPEIFTNHWMVMLAVIALILIAAILRIRFRTWYHATVRRVYLGVLLVAVVLVAFGGHLGGQLVYGEQHLPF